MYQNPGRKTVGVEYFAFAKPSNKINIGTVPLTIYKGRTTSTAGTVVAAGGLFGIPKGYSTITVANPSSTTTGVFTALRGR